MPLEAARSTGKHSRGRGVIVNRNYDEVQAQATAQYGEPSEVIILKNIEVEPEEEAALRQEIGMLRHSHEGEECNNHGYVSKILLHRDEQHRLLVFVQFTGMAGAYRAVRALNKYVLYTLNPATFLGGHTPNVSTIPLQHSTLVPLFSCNSNCAPKKKSSHRDSNTGPKVVGRPVDNYKPSLFQLSYGWVDAQVAVIMLLCSGLNTHRTPIWTVHRLSFGLHAYAGRGDGTPCFAQVGVAGGQASRGVREQGFTWQPRDPSGCPARRRGGGHFVWALVAVLALSDDAVGNGAGFLQYVVNLISSARKKLFNVDQVYCLDDGRVRCRVS